MVGFRVNSNRIDPYKNFKFRVRWDGQIVAGVSKVSGLKRTTEVVTHRSGADISRHNSSPGITSYEPIILERGITHDTAFEEWANQVFNLDGDSAISLKNYKKDIIIELLNLQGVPVISYVVYRCWVMQYEPITILDSDVEGDGGDVAIERIVLTHAGWERDLDVKEPQET